MNFIVKEKNFYKTVFSLAIPVALQNLITFAISMMDTVMMGLVGEVQLSATSIANQISFVMMILLFGIAGGANVMIAQYWGKGDLEHIKKIIALMQKFMIVAVAIFTFIALFLPQQAMSIFTTDEKVIEEGVRYLKVIAYSYIFFGISNTTMMMLRSVGTVNISILVYGTSLIVNTTLNYIFIFGKLGFPAMGIVGAALATLISRIVESIIVIIFMCKFENKICYHLKYFFASSKHIFASFVKTASPVMFNELLWSLGASAVAVVIGRMGTQFVAANSISSVVNQFVSVLIFGVGSATSVVIGNTIGEGKYDKAKQYARTLMVMGFALGIVSATLTILVRPLAISFYNVSDLTKEYAYQIMAVGAGISFFQALAVVSMMGILRGGGDSKFVLVTDVIFMWIIAIPLGFLTGLKLGWSVPAVFAVLKCDEMLKTFFSVARVFKGKWIKDVTKE